VIPDPVQLLAVRVTLKVVQVKGPLLLQLSEGGVVLPETTVVQMLVHPLAVEVAITVYVPATDTEGHCKAEAKPFGPLQL
jgi:hypothetical protein